MTRQPIRIRRLVLVIIPLALVGAGVFLWNFPMLGKPIQAFPTENPILFSTPPAFTPIVEEVPAANLPLPAVSTLEAPVPGENADPPVERNAYDAWLILALGVDKVAQSDVIRLIRVDYAAEKVTVVSIPRDLFLPIPGFDDHGITQGRINAAYGYGEFFLGKGQGIISTANAFTANFGITFDRYAVGQFSSFVKLVDQVGGLDITLEEGYYGPPAGGPSFPAGDYHLYGEDTLILARVRYGDDDHHRIDRQTVILKALMGKVYDTMNLVELTSFGLETIRDKGVVTDLTVGDLYTLAQFGKSLTQEDITFVSIPREFYYPARTTTGASVILPREGLIPFIQAQLGVGE